MKKDNAFRKWLLILFIILVAITLLFAFLEILTRASNSCKVSPKGTGNLFNFIRKSNSLGYELEPLSEGFLKSVKVKINSDGLRDYEYSKEKSEGTYRIVTIGDKLTFGWGVNLEASYPKILERTLNKTLEVEVINFAVPGYKGEQRLRVLQEKALDYNPDLVIIEHSLSTPGDAWNLYETKTPIPIFIKTFFSERSCFYNWVKEKYKERLESDGTIKGYPYKKLHEEGSEFWERYKNVLRGFKEISESEEIPILVVIFPIWENLDDSYSFKKEHHLLNTTINNFGLYSLDLLPEIYGLNGEEYLLDDTDAIEVNYEGYKIVAEAIRKKLANEEIQ